MGKKIAVFTLQDIFTLFLIAVFAFGLFEVRGLGWGAQVFPLVVTIPAIILSIMQLITDMRRRAKGKGETADFVDIAVDESVPSRTAYLKALRYFGWFIAYYLVMWLVGFKITTLLFFILFLKIEARGRWLNTLLMTAITAYLVFVHFEKILSVHWPDNLMGRWFDIPWLF